MNRQSAVVTTLQKTIDWSVFVLGALALVTAITATVLGEVEDRLAGSAEVENVL